MSQYVRRREVDDNDVHVYPDKTKIFLVKGSNFSSVKLEEKLFTLELNEVKLMSYKRISQKAYLH